MSRSPWRTVLLGGLLVTAAAGLGVAVTGAAQAAPPPDYVTVDDSAGPDCPYGPGTTGGGAADPGDAGPAGAGEAAL